MPTVLAPRGGQRGSGSTQLHLEAREIRRAVGRVEDLPRGEDVLHGKSVSFLNQCT